MTSLPAQIPPVTAEQVDANLLQMELELAMGKVAEVAGKIATALATAADRNRMFEAREKDRS